jgi:hypothetical protein
MAIPQLAGSLILIVFGIIFIMIMVIIAAVRMAVVADAIQYRAQYGGLD